MMRLASRVAHRVTQHSSARLLSTLAPVAPNASASGRSSRRLFACAAAVVATGLSIALASRDRPAQAAAASAPSPPPAAASASSSAGGSAGAAGSAPTDGSADGGDDVEEFRTALPYSDPNHRGLTLLVSDLVEPLLLQRDRPNALSQPVPRELAHVLPRGSIGQELPFRPYGALLSVTDPTCSACATQRPVLLALAAALSHDASVRVLSYDARANYRPGFLSEEELAELPLIKFYPPLAARRDATPQDSLSPGAADGIVYEGPPNARAILSFLSAHATPEAPVDVAAVQARLDAHAAETDAAVRAAVDARLQTDPAFNSYAHSPCGAQMMAWMRLTLATRMLSQPLPEEELKRAFDEFQRCVQSKDGQMRRYWTQLAAIAHDNLEKYEQRDENRRQKEQ